MYVAVATKSFLLIVNLENKQVIPIEHHRTEYYGISWFPEQTELVLSHSGIDNVSLVDIETYAQSELGRISMGEATTDPFLSQPHQILCASDGRVVCTNTGRNSILVINLSKPGHFQEVRLSAPRWDRLSLSEQEGDHINSVFERSGRLYVIAHGHKKGSLLATFAYPEMELLTVDPAGSRSGLHNIWITEEGQRISCHTEAGALVDLGEDAIVWESGSPAYTRGLASSSNVIVVGESEKTGRGLRRGSWSGLWIIDRLSWKTLDYIGLGPFGPVHEVRLLDVPDEAHHSQIFGGVSLLTAKDMRPVVARQRVASAAAAFETRRLWAGYKLVFGTPMAEADGYRATTSEELCLAVRNELSPDVEFHYGISMECNISHVAAVVGYEGPGTDTDMTALLLSVFGGRARLSVWHHDGAAWMVLPGLGLGDLPLSGHVRVVRHCKGVTMRLDGKEVFELTVAQIGTILRGRCGIRWLGSHVRPCST